MESMPYNMDTEPLASSTSVRGPLRLISIVGAGSAGTVRAHSLRCLSAARRAPGRRGALARVGAVNDVPVARGVHGARRDRGSFSNETWRKKRRL